LANSVPNLAKNNVWRERDALQDADESNQVHNIENRYALCFIQKHKAGRSIPISKERIFKFQNYEKPSMQTTIRANHYNV